jgi:hypothetical protein
MDTIAAWDSSLMESSFMESGCPKVIAVSLMESSYPKTSDDGSCAGSRGQSWYERGSKPVSDSSNVYGGSSVPVWGDASGGHGNK